MFVPTRHGVLRSVLTSSRDRFCAIEVFTRERFDNSFCNLDEVSARTLWTYGLMTHSCALDKQGQTVSQPSWIACTCRTTEGCKAFVLRFFEVLDNAPGWMSFVRELYSRVGKVAAVPLVKEALSSHPHPTVQLRQWVSRIVTLQLRPQLLRPTGLIAQALGYQLVLGAEVTVEGHFVGSGRLRDRIDSYPLDPVLAE